MINGLEELDMTGEAAVRKWCEKVGEVKEFEKRGKGCLVVDYRKASVADTVSIFFFFLCWMGLLMIDYDRCAVYRRRCISAARAASV